MSSFFLFYVNISTRILDGNVPFPGLYRGLYCPFAPKWGVVFVDPLPPNLHTEGNFQARFSQRKSIEL